MKWRAKKMNRLRPKQLNFYLLMGVIIMICFSCSTTKNLPQDEVLYTGISKMDWADKKEKTEREADDAWEEVSVALAYPPNNALLGSSSVRVPFPFGLWVYNSFVHSEKGLGKWIFKNMAAKPVYISTVNPEVRTKVVQNILKENGYFNNSVFFEVVPHKNNPKKAKVNYIIRMNEPYAYDSIEYRRMQHRADTLLKMTESERLIRKGDIFNVVKLEGERQRISSLLRNNGYFYFRPDYLSYQADTSITKGKVALRLSLNPGTPRNALRPWKVGNISLRLNGYTNETPTDSLLYKDMMIHYEGKLRVRPSVIYDRIMFKTGETYSQLEQSRTQSRLNQLGIFRYTEMQYVPQDTSRRSRNDSLDLRINTVYDLPLDGELEFNMTSKSNNMMGPGMIYSLTKRNLFGGGETFGASIRGSYEWQTGNRIDGTNTAINNYEFGLSTTLTFPTVLFPGFRRRSFDFPATTTFRLYGSQLNRSKFFRMLSFGGTMTYDFQPTVTSRHSIIPFRLTFNKLTNPTARFDSIINENKALAQSLEDQFVPAIGYTYTYDNSSLRQWGNSWWWQVSVTESGNLLSGLYALAGQGFNTKKKLLGSTFSQFLKVTNELRYNLAIDRNQSIAARLGVGAIYSYGNAKVSPYSEQFYVGGANSIRAFTIRSIGPGRFKPQEGSAYSYIDQTGDLKLEANVEYRFRLLGDLKGAVFLDAGNVWLIRDDENRPDGRLKLGSFLNDLAVGTGAGLRYDLSFLVVRFDVGVALHVPYETSKSGYYNIEKFGKGLGFHLAVGYPF